MAHPPGNRSIACRCSDCAGPTQWAARRRALGRTPLSCPGRAQRDPGPRGSTSCGPWVPALARERAPRARRHAEARARPGHEHVAADAMCSEHDMPKRRSRHSLFTMSNSPVFFIPGAFSPPGSSPSLSTFVAARPPSEGIGGAPRDVQPCTCRASNARRHACEAWALPRNREARLTALRRGVVGPGPASVPVAGSGAKAPRPPGTSARLRLPGFSCPRLPAAVDATSRSAFRIVSGDAPHERDFGYIAQARYVVNNIFITYS